MSARLTLCAQSNIKNYRARVYRDTGHHVEAIEALRDSFASDAKVCSSLGMLRDFVRVPVDAGQLICNVDSRFLLARQLETLAAAAAATMTPEAAAAAMEAPSADATLGLTDDNGSGYSGDVTGEVAASSLALAIGAVLDEAEHLYATSVAAMRAMRMSLHEFDVSSQWARESGGGAGDNVPSLRWGMCLWRWATLLQRRGRAHDADHVFRIGVKLVSIFVVRYSPRFGLNCFF